MSVTSDILESWRRPRVVVRRLLGQARSEPFAFSLLVTGLILFYVSLTPWTARIASNQAGELGTSWLELLIPWLLGSALGVAATVPLWYLIAALARLAAQLIGGKGSFYGARVALFWALVAASPAVLASGIVKGMLGSGGASDGIGLIAAAAFLVLWVMMLREAER